MEQGNTDEHIGRRIAELRRQADLSQRELAEAVGLDPSALSRIEGGQRALSVGELLAVAGYLGIGVDSVIGGEVEPFAASERNDDPEIRRTVRDIRDVMEDFFMFQAAAK